MDFESNVEGDEEFDARQVRHPWTKGERLDPGLIDDLQIPMFEAWDDEGKFFVVKEVRIDSNQTEELLQELKSLCSLNHKNIVQYMGTDISTDKKTISVFLKLMGQKSLLSIYKGYKRGLSELQVRRYTLHILNGLKYLHVDKKMEHGDIRCATIWVDDDGVCKLTGFRRPEKLIADMDRSNLAQTTIPWTAQEAFDKGKKRGLYSDIWSLGCTVIEMASGSPPYGELDEGAAFRKIAEGELPPIPDTLSENGKDFVKQCLQFDIEKRPLITSLLKHPFVTTAYYPNSVLYNLYEKERRVAYGLRFTTKIGADELQGSGMADSKKSFEKANDTIKLINKKRHEYHQIEFSVDPEGPAELVLKVDATDSSYDSEGDEQDDLVETDPESRLSSESSEIQSSEGRTYSKEAFEESFTDISYKIKSRTSNMYILDGEWMGQLVFEDKVQIYNQFEGEGYVETTSTDELVCFENIASLSRLELLSQQLASSIEFSSCSNDALPSTSHVGQTTSQGESSYTSDGQQGDSMKPVQWRFSLSNWFGNILKLFWQSNSTSDISVTRGNECGDDCRRIQLQVSSSRPESTVTGPLDRVILTFAQDFAYERKRFLKRLQLSKSKKPILPTIPPRITACVKLSSCIEEENFCIKLHYLRGYVKNAVEGTVVNCLRISIAAEVQGEPIQLTCMPMDNDILLRVIQHGKSPENFDNRRRTHNISTQFSPSLGVNPVTLAPAVTVGSMTITPREEMLSFRKQNDDLTLLYLMRGSKDACEDLEIQMCTTIVLKRHLANELFVNNYNAELTSVLMNDDQNPVKLIAKVPDFTSVDINNFKIRCCVELEISNISIAESETYKFAGKLITEGERQYQTVPFDEHFTLVRG